MSCLFFLTLLNLKFFPEIDAATADPITQIPGFVACVVNKDDKMIFSYASSKRGVNSSDLMTLTAFSGLLHAQR